MVKGMMLGRSHSLPVLCVSNVARTLENNNRRNALWNVLNDQRSEKTSEINDQLSKRRSSSIIDGSTEEDRYSICYNHTSNDFEIVDGRFGAPADESRVLPKTDNNAWCNPNDDDGDFRSSTERKCDPNTSTAGDINLTIDHLTTHTLEQSAFVNRRLSLADIFEHVGQNSLVELLAVYSGSTVNELGQIYRNARRNALSDVYENIPAVDLKMFLTGFEETNGTDSWPSDESEYSSDETLADEEEQMLSYFSRNRRNALGYIYDGVASETIDSIAGQSAEIEEEAKHFNYESRRMGLANIKEVVPISEISRLNDDYDETLEAGHVGRCRERRPALGDIYSEMDTEEMGSFLKRFSDDTDSETES